MAKKNNTTMCEVCETAILGNDCFSMGEDKWRHKKCGPGSKAWKAKYGESEIGAMLSKKATRPASAPGTKSAEKNDPIYRAVKEFCGRDKYMRYMDSVNSNPINWSIATHINGHAVESGKYDDPPIFDAIYAKVKG